MQELNRKVLTTARSENDSNEVMCLMVSGYIIEKSVKGTANSVKVEEDAEIAHALRISKRGSIVLAHNHPNLSYFSIEDLKIFVKYPSIKTMTVVTNRGKVWHITKKNNFSDLEANNIVFDAVSKKGVTYDKALEEALKGLYNMVERNKGW